MEIIVGKNGMLRYSDPKHHWKYQAPSTVISAFSVGKRFDNKMGYSLSKTFPTPRSTGSILKESLMGKTREAFVGRLGDGSLYLLPSRHFTGDDIIEHEESVESGNQAQPIAEASLELWKGGSMCSPESTDPKCRQLYHTVIDSTLINVQKPNTLWPITFFLFCIFFLALLIWRRRNALKKILKLRQQVQENLQTDEKPLKKSPKPKKKRVKSDNNELGDVPRTITVTQDILGFYFLLIAGFGSHGTVVFKGRFEGRDVAVKRLLVDFFDVAETEVNLLRDSDHHPNVIRYFMKEQTERFVFIALELSPASLYDVIEQQNSSKLEELKKSINPKQVLYQIMLGINHLHSLKMVHRYVEPLT